jgi:hypothetical protein
MPVAYLLPDHLIVHGNAMPVIVRKISGEWDRNFYLYYL